MKYTNITYQDISVTVDISSFGVENGVAEYHAILQLTDKFANAYTQYQHIELALDRLLQSEELQNTVLVLKRYFVSDATNQSEFLNKGNDTCAISVVQQPPMNGTKVAIWAYFVENSEMCTDESGTSVLVRPKYKHLYNTQLHKPLKDEYKETEFIFNTYLSSLAKHGCTLKDNCIRTWIYVQGADIHYSEMVKARIACFDKEGLGKTSHYIASTGIEGKYTDPNSLVLMDAYAIDGIVQKQINYLQAPTHLNPTHEYGVTFERGTSVDYGDRRHIFISGTASIDNKGQIVHLSDVGKQLDRVLENINTLLSEAGAGMEHVAKMIVYLRDTADYTLIKKQLEEKHLDIPKVIVWAPVCRPGWLVEIECMAMKEIRADRFDKF